jgi:RimJ/RimL family protein N-acetyltransferase
MMCTAIEIETPRLLLRPPCGEDLDDWSAFMGDVDAARFIGGAQPRSGAWRSLMIMVGAWHTHGFAMFSAVEKATGQWIGRVGPWKPEGWPSTEVGWGIIPARWGRGYATEASIAATHWAFERLGWSEVIHAISPDNVASQSVARRLGSSNRGPEKLPPPFDSQQIEIWGQTREQWERNWGRPSGPHDSLGARASELVAAFERRRGA